MQHKQKGLIFFIAALLLFAGCVGKPVALPPRGEEELSGENISGSDEAMTIKTGLSVMIDFAGSQNANASKDGTVQTNVSLVAVTVDDAGIITECVFDAITAELSFSADGQVTSDTTKALLSRNALGTEYGMKAASSIGKEWYEQASAFAKYVKGKTVEELGAIAVDERGAPLTENLSASVTISIHDFLEGVEAAVAAARPLGAQAEDRLCLASFGDMSGSASAASAQNGTATSNVSIAAVTFSGERISSCLFDGVQTIVHFNEAGEIITDLSQKQRSKNGLGDAYGMRQASSIGKEWYEQATAFADYVRGKTVGEVEGIAVDAGEKTTEPDLTQSVTIRIGDFQRLLRVAAGDLYDRET